MLSFSFENYSVHGGNYEGDGEHFKNSLLFKRREYIEPKLNQAINEIFTKYVPPVIPIPGGFIIDFVRAYKMITEMGESSESERRRRRLEQLKEKLQLSIKRFEALEKRGDRF